jgi:hypothetical protein
MRETLTKWRDEPADIMPVDPALAVVVRDQAGEGQLQEYERMVRATKRHISEALITAGLAEIALQRFFARFPLSHLTTTEVLAVERLEARLANSERVPGDVIAVQALQRAMYMAETMLRLEDNLAPLEPRSLEALRGAPGPNLNGRRPGGVRAEIAQALLERSPMTKIGKNSVLAGASRLVAVGLLCSQAQEDPPT